MSNFVLIHLGTSLPSHLQDCVKQIQSTNKNADIILVSNLNINAPGINCINTKSLQIKETGRYFQYDTDPLWVTSLKRIFILDSLMQKFSLKNTVHFDNDVLIYYNINEIEDRLTEPLYITPHKHTEFSFGFCYAKNSDSLCCISEKIHKLIELGESEVRKLTRDEIHEMRLLGFVNNKLISSLPVHPEIHTPIKEFIFDPSSYGQFLGGTPNGHASGFIDKEQLVGKIFTEHYPEIHFQDKKPILFHKGIKYKIFNLHVHSKNLSLFKL